MKKFISLGIMMIVLTPAFSCREAEDVTSLPQTAHKVMTNVKQDSVKPLIQPMDTGIEDINTPPEKKEDPDKDKIKW